MVVSSMIWRYRAARSATVATRAAIEPVRSAASS